MLTNLAKAIQEAPNIAQNIPKLTAMGGHLYTIPVISCAAANSKQSFPFGLDYNLCADPDASLLVLTTISSIVLIPADVTMQVQLSEQHMQLLADQHDISPFIPRLLADMKEWIPHLRQFLDRYSCDQNLDIVAFLHDPLTVACVIDESFCEFEDLCLDLQIVESESTSLSHGKGCHRIFRTIPVSDASATTRRIRCAVRVNAAEFVDHFMCTILR